MLHLISDAFRNRGPVGWLFVTLMIVFVGGPVFFWPFLRSMNAVDFLPGIWIASVILLPFLLRWRRRRKRWSRENSGPIHAWPKLGQNDRLAIRSKLTQPVKRR